MLDNITDLENEYDTGLLTGTSFALPDKLTPSEILFTRTAHTSVWD